MLEHAVDDQLSPFITQKDVQDLYLSGFKAAHSTEMAHVSVADELHAA